MRLRARLVLLSVSTVATIVLVLATIHLDSLTSFWLTSAAERCAMAGAEIRAVLVDRVTAAPSTGSPDEVKRAWYRAAASDRTLGDVLVEQAAMPSASIVEINITGDDGKVLVSSVPARVGQREPLHADLKSVTDAGAWSRLSSILNANADWETLIPLGTPERPDPVFEIQLLVSPVLLRDKLKPDLERTAMATLIALLAAIVLAAVTANLALRPVRRISSAVDMLAAGRPLGLSFVSQSEPSDSNEIAAVEYKLGLLGQKMEGARRDADQMRQAIGTLARGVAHEIRNPLNAIALRLESLRGRVADDVPEAEADIDLVAGEVQRLDRVVHTFLDLNRPRELEVSEFDAMAMSEGIVDVLRPAAEQAGVELSASGARSIVRADRGLIEQAVVNVVNNAIQATPRNGKVEIRVTSDGNCGIAVTDTGSGIPDEVRARMFEPYFTTKKTGSGIGLAFTKRAIDLHSGTIRVESSPGNGTSIVLEFPAVGNRA